MSLVRPLRSFLKRSPFLVRIVFAARRKMGGLRWNSQILDSLPVFSPNSAGAIREKASLALASADRAFPTLLELISTRDDIELQTKSLIPLEPLTCQGEAKTLADQFGEAFDRNGSDKTELQHHFLYATLLAKNAGKDLDILEIGLGTNDTRCVSHMGKHGRPGASLRAFRDCLPNARVFGADIDRGCLFEEERIQTTWADQTRPETIRELSKLSGRGYDLIIDDGLHSPDANLHVLLFALDQLKPGGTLVIEDITPHARPLWNVVEALLPEKMETRLYEASSGELVFTMRFNSE
jgi:SAM-dependent methyltransferase